jgi:DNA-binding transcriptional regulator YdaS (Cro superfamily)
MSSTGIQAEDPAPPKHTPAIEQVVERVNCDLNRSNDLKWDQLDLLERGMSAMFDPELFS